MIEIPISWLLICSVLAVVMFLIWDD